jgi:hypothetical protein
MYHLFCDHLRQILENHVQLEDGLNHGSNLLFSIANEPKNNIKDKIVDEIVDKL